MKALALFASGWFSPADEKETRFKLRGLTGREQAEYMPDFMSVGDDLAIPASTMISILTKCLEDWENFEGAPPFKKGDESMIDYLPVALQAELIGEIMRRSVSGPEDKKKSPSRQK